jgi:hypothetical protein
MGGVDASTNSDLADAGERENGQMRQMQTIGTLSVLTATLLVALACNDRSGRTPTEPGLDARDAQASLDRDGDSDGHLRAVPFVFVGRAGDCGAGYPAGSRIVTAAWLGGMGLPDNGGPNAGTVTTDNPNKNDAHFGLLLSKNGPTPDCSSSGARIRGVNRMEVDATFVLGFDYRNGGHCGAGAPRFNVTVRNARTKMETSHFVGGCANGVSVQAEQDPQWSTVRFTVAQQFPPIPPGSTIRSISILYDEGTEVPTLQDPNGVGLAVIDNIFIDGRFIRRGQGIADGSSGQGNDRDSDK